MQTAMMHSSQRMLLAVAAAVAASPAPAPDWTALPPEVLSIILGQHLTRRAARQAAFRSCKAFARALLAASSGQPSLRLDVQRHHGFAPCVRLLQQLAPQQQRAGQTHHPVTVVLFTSGHMPANPQACLEQLAAARVSVRCASRLVVERLVLDALLPANLHRVLPRLQQLSLLHCRLAPAAADAVLNAACAHLRAIEIRELTAAPTPPAAAGAAGAANHGAAQASVGLQLMQLSRLPALQSVHLLDSSCPTLFLTLLGARLTSLHLAPAYRQWVHGTQTPTPAWRATLQHVARCTALQDLAVPCVTAEELRLLAHAPAPGASPSRSPPHLADMDEGEDEEDVEEGQEEQRVGGGDAPLGRLQRLHLSGPRVEVADGLGVLEVLLALPRLARLRWEDCSGHCFAPGGVGGKSDDVRATALRPCRWRELSFASVGPHQLACLPLHSLTSPVAWGALELDRGSSAAEVAAAVANVTRNCPAGCAWRPDAGFYPTVCFRPTAALRSVFTRGATERDTPAALLRALSPLLSPHPHQCDDGAPHAAASSSSTELTASRPAAESPPWSPQAAGGAEAAGPHRTAGAPGGGPGLGLRLGFAHAPALNELSVANLAWDAALVRLLGRVLPRSCVELTIDGGVFGLDACVEVAASLPQLRRLWLLEVQGLHPAAVLCLLSCVKCLASSSALGREGPGGGGSDGGDGERRLVYLGVTRPARPEAVGEEAHRAAWDEVQAQVGALGMEGLEFELDW